MYVATSEFLSFFSTCRSQIASRSIIQISCAFGLFIIFQRAKRALKFYISRPNSRHFEPYFPGFLYFGIFDQLSKFIFILVSIPDKPECVHHEPVTLGVVPKRDAEVRVKLILYISFENLKSLHTKLVVRLFPLYCLLIPTPSASKRKT